KEALERINRNVLGGRPLRDEKTGKFNGVVVHGYKSAEGYTDVLIDNGKTRELRYWDPMTDGIGVWKSISLALLPTKPLTFEDDLANRQIELAGKVIYLEPNDKKQADFIWVKEDRGFVKAKFSLPPGARLPRGDKDYGLRFIDLDEDGIVDVVFSNDQEYGVYLFTDME